MAILAKIAQHHWGASLQRQLPTELSTAWVFIHRSNSRYLTPGVIKVANNGTNILNPNSINNIQTCGGHINSTDLAVSGFIQTNGQVTKYSKGYVCPLGQVCMVNPIQSVEAVSKLIKFH
jgi:hypothetical protein